jgi:hypothetical protein
MDSGRVSAPELAAILAPPASSSSTKKTEYPSRRRNLIFEKIGRGIPADIQRAASQMSEKDLVELIRLAKRPEARASTRAELEDKIQKQLSEEAQALRKKHFIRARDLRDCIEELQSLRAYLPTLEEIEREAVSLQEGLDNAVSSRRYDVANNIQIRLTSLEKQIQKEKE